MSSRPVKASPVGGSKRKVVAIIQARVGSSRLPGKVLAEIADAPMLEHVLNRSARIEGVEEVVLATTDRPDDDPLVDLCGSLDFGVHRGHPTDVLDRYYHAARSVEADVVVRITGDCPLLDPLVSEETLEAFLNSEPPLDFAANRLPDHRTYPIGLDTEVCSMSSLSAAWNEAKEPHQREHVMPYLYENPGRFRTKVLDAPGDWGDLRWTVDTQDDLEFVRAVFKAFAPRRTFNWREVLALLERKPELAEINRDVQHRRPQDVDRRFQPAQTAE